MQSIKNRLGDKIPEVLDYTRQYGRSAAMDKFGIKDYICFDKFLKEETDEPNFGVAPINRPRISNRPVDVQLFQAYARKVSLLKTLARLRSEGKGLDKRIEDLEQQLVEAEEALNVGRDYEPCEVRI